MKLPDQYDDTDYNNQLFDACQKAAIQLTIRTGTIVQAVMRHIEPVGGWANYKPDPLSSEQNKEIVFKSMGKFYDNLKEVKRAIRMKVFS